MYLRFYTPIVINSVIKIQKDTWIQPINTALKCFLSYIRTVRMTVTAASSLMLQNRYSGKVIWITFQNNLQHRSSMQSKNFRLLLALSKIYHVSEFSSLWVSLTLSFPILSNILNIYKGPADIHPDWGKGSSPCTGFKIETTLDTFCQHKLFCLSSRNFSAVRACWSKFLLKLSNTSLPLLNLLFKSHLSVYWTKYSINKQESKSFYLELLVAL